MPGEAASFEKINYAVRPAKATQRHMLVEAIGRLTRFRPLTDYQYLGFGSTFFVDFRLLHQRYGMKRLFSVEQEEEKRRRFDLNRPFQSVQMLYGEAKKMLLDDSIDWESDPAIVWLDYDRRLDKAKLGDCDRVLRRAAHGSLLIVTFDAEPGKLAGREQRIRDDLEDWVPYEATDATLDTDSLAELGLDVLTKHAHQVLEEAGGEMVFKQLFRMRYSDGHAMATWGGLVLGADQADEADACGFDELPYVTLEGEPTYAIEIPNLTPVERALIERYLPRHRGRARRALAVRDIPPEEADRLAAVYRYAPTFVETFA